MKSTISKLEQEKAMKVLTVAKTRLVLLSPFFGSLICRRPPIISDSVPTAGVDARGKLYVNPKFLATLTVDKVVFLLAHETLHIAFQHALREGDRDHETWNIACDAVINQLLMKERIGEFITGGVDMPQYADSDAESVYADLIKEQKKQGGKGGDGGYSISADPLGNDVDTTGASGMTETEKAAVKSEIRQAVAEAQTSARMQGKGEGSLFRTIDNLLKVKTPWHSILERFMVGLAKQELSWSRANRRYARIAYLPSISSTPSMGGVVIGVDTSGSISNEELGKFLGHMNAIFEQCHPEWVKVVYCDDEIHHVDEFDKDDGEITAGKIEGCGGTDMTRIFDWIEDEGIEPDVCIVFTDGYTPYPDETPCDTVWAITTPVSAPEEAGLTLHIE